VNAISTIDGRRPFAHQYRRRSRLGSYGTRFGMGDVLTPQEAESQVVTPSQYSGAKMTQTEVDAIIETASSGQLPFGPADWAAEFNCTGQANPGSAQLAKTAAGISLTVGTGIAGALGVSGAILGPIGAAVTGIIGLFTAILQHHAQAQAKEENILCQVVPALNNTLQAIDAAVADGTLTPAGAMATMADTQQEFASAVSSIIKDDQTHCNAACVWTMCLAALALVRNSQWQQMEDIAATQSTSTSTVTAGQAAQSVVTGQPVVSGATVSTAAPATTAGEIPTWAYLAAAGVAAFFLLR
jgi:hypothetical protein